MIEGQKGKMGRMSTNVFRMDGSPFPTHYLRVFRGPVAAAARPPPASARPSSSPGGGRVLPLREGGTPMDIMNGMSREATQELVGWKSAEVKGACSVRYVQRTLRRIREQPCPAPALIWGSSGA